MTAAPRWIHRDLAKKEIGFIFVGVVIGLMFGFSFGLLVQDEPKIDFWDKAAAVGDSFSGHDITERHPVKGLWGEGANADIDAAVENFIEYRAERYDEEWPVTVSSCGARIVECGA